MPSGLPRLDDFRRIVISRCILRALVLLGVSLLDVSLVHAQTASASASAASPIDDASPLKESIEAVGPSIFPSRDRPTLAEVPRRACSFSAPVCLHATNAVSDVSMAHVLLAAEKFYRTIQVLHLPEPLPDAGLGGDDRYDIYLIPGADGPPTIPDFVFAGQTWDRASAFSILSPPIAPFGCDSEALVARALARASVYRIDAGIEDSSLAMTESYLADVVTDCSTTNIAAVDVFQRFTEKTLGFHAPNEASGAFLFARYLDDTYGLGVPGGVLFGLLSVAGQHRHPMNLQFANEPDLFDVLRSNMRLRGKPIDDLWLDFAIDRAFVGSRSDGGHLNDVDKYGDAGRVRFEWSIPLATLPRRLAPMRPIEALGTTYLWLDLKGAPEKLDLAFVADWEAGVLFHWSIIKVDAEGIEMGRIAVAGIRGSTHAERAILGIQGVSGLLIVGVNVGSIDRGHPFDPDEHEMARSYTVTLFRQ